MAANTFDPGELMKLAIETMRQSVHESREDHKVNPLVGAVLLHADGTRETACRGELRDGDHAEFTILERMNRSTKLDGSVLFTTLEPCAPGSRSHPKRSCAERIVDARIKEVWIGIEDLDPLVDRKGIKHLQDSHVIVHMFDRELQEIIKEENTAYLEGALERAAAARDEELKPAALSALEEILPAADTNDLSRSALDQYRSVAKVDDKVDSQIFNRRLSQVGVLKEQGGGLKPTGFGLLLFGKEPRTTMPHAGLLGTIHYSDGSEETRDFDGPQVFAPDQALQWLRDKLPNPIDRSEAQRHEKNQRLFELVREGIVNALVHRDYAIEGAKCQVAATSDTITIRSPGEPVPPITLKQLQKFEAPMLSRNPILHYVFAQMKLAEERGLGLKSMREAAVRAGLPLPTYLWDDPYLVLTVYRNPEAALSKLAPEISDALNDQEKQGWEFLASRLATTRSEYASHFGFDTRKAQRHLRKFVNLGLLSRFGAGSSTRYEVIR